MNHSNEKSALITGVSSGIGRALAAWYLEQGWTVYGSSRRTPDALTDHENFHFASMDLSDVDAMPTALMALVDDRRHFDLVILNAGVLGQFGDLGDADLDDLDRTMQINVWANKVFLDALFSSEVAIDQVVAISSGASVNGHRGWGGYAISKAALNMLVALYARERPDTHFCALAPGLVDTEIQEQLRALPPDDRFQSVANIAAKHNTPEMPTPAQAATLLASAMKRLPSLVESGAYADVRKM